MLQQRAYVFQYCFTVAFNFKTSFFAKTEYIGKCFACFLFTKSVAHVDNW